MALAHRTSRSPQRCTPESVPCERESGVRLREDRPSTTGANPDDLRALATAADAASLGLAACARRARSPEVAEKTAALGESMKIVAARARELVPGGMRRASTSERLRWEWLASTASLLDGGPERRLAAEVERHLAIAADVAARLDSDDPELLVAPERIRVAALFCRALATGSDPLRALSAHTFVRP